MNFPPGFSLSYGFALVGSNPAVVAIISPPVKGGIPFLYLDYFGTCVRVKRKYLGLGERFRVGLGDKELQYEFLELSLCYVHHIQVYCKYIEDVVGS